MNFDPCDPLAEANQRAFDHRGHSLCKSFVNTDIAGAVDWTRMMKLLMLAALWEMGCAVS